MSVRSSFEMCCPKCYDDSEITITFTGTCKLVPDGSEDCGDHEWNDDSAATCGACGFAGVVKDFEIDRK
jgi:hypothetical protein